MMSKQKDDLAWLLRLSSLNEAVEKRSNSPRPFLKYLTCDIWETVEMVGLPDLLLFQPVSDPFP